MARAKLELAPDGLTLAAEADLLRYENAFLKKAKARLEKDLEEKEDRIRELARLLEKMQRVVDLQSAAIAAGRSG